MRTTEMMLLWGRGLDRDGIMYLLCTAPKWIFKSGWVMKCNSPWIFLWWKKNCRVSGHKAENTNEAVFVRLKVSFTLLWKTNCRLFSGGGVAYFGTCIQVCPHPGEQYPGSWFVHQTFKMFAVIYSFCAILRDERRQTKLVFTLQT